MKGALATVADGVLLSASQATIEDPPDVPLVLLGEHTATPYGDHVGIDNVAASRTVVRHLLSQGCRVLAALGVNDSDTAVLRLRGFHEELDAWGIGAAPRLELATSDWSPRGGYEAVARLLSADRRALPEALQARISFLEPVLVGIVVLGGGLYGVQAIAERNLLATTLSEDDHPVLKLNKM